MGPILVTPAGENKFIWKAGVPIFYLGGKLFFFFFPNFKKKTAPQ